MRFEAIVTAISRRPPVQSEDLERNERAARITTHFLSCSVIRFPRETYVALSGNGNCDSSRKQV